MIRERRRSEQFVLVLCSSNPNFSVQFVLERDSKQSPIEFCWLIMSRTAPKKMSKKSNSMRYYDILGVPKLAWDEKLERAYRKAVIMNDPDKGGDPEKLMKAVQAYKVLSDPKKRRIYDKYGEDGLKEEERKKRGRDVNRSLKVSLEELYTGISKSVKHIRRVLCPSCVGKGSKPGPLIKCSGCKGTGMAQLGPSGTPQPACVECNGTGAETVPRCQCEKCSGKKFQVEKKTIWIDVEKGVNHLHEITIPGEADEELDTITRNLVIKIMQKDHPKFLRNGEDLFYKHTLSLAEALCGYRFLLTHLDGRKLLIKSAFPHEIVQSDSYWKIKDEGMPVYQHKSRRGNLYIHFKVELPVELTDEQHQILVSTFPPTTSECTAAAEICDATIPILHVVIDDEKMRRREAAART